MKAKTTWSLVAVVAMATVVVAGCGGGGPAVVAGLDGGLVGQWLMLAGESVEVSEAGQQAGPVTITISANGTVRMEAERGDQWVEGNIDGEGGSGTIVWTNCSVTISQLSKPPMNEPIAFTYTRSGSRVTLQYSPEAAAVQGTSSSDVYVKLREIGPIMLIGQWIVAPPPAEQASWDGGDFEMVSMQRNGAMGLSTYVAGSPAGSTGGQWLASEENHVLWKLPEQYRQCTFETDGGWATLHFPDEDLTMFKCEHEFSENLAGSWTDGQHSFRFRSEGDYTLQVDGQTVETGTARSCCYDYLLFDCDGQMRWAEFELAGDVLTINQWQAGLQQQWVLDRTLF